MLRNFFKTAFRSLSANKVYSIITVAGLGTGIAVVLVIFIFIRYEQSFDDFHTKKAQIYRVLTQDAKPGVNNYPTSAVPYPVPTALKNDFPQWKVTGILSFTDVQVLAMGQKGHRVKKFKEKDGFFAVAPSFFSIFDFPWLAGNPIKSLQDRKSVVLTRTTADRYFGDWKQAVGRTIQIQNKDLFTVTGILADPPSNTDLQLKGVFSYAVGNLEKSTDWWTISDDHECYVLLPPNEDAADANHRLKAFSKKYRTADNHNFQLLQPLSAVHFDAKAGNYSGRTITSDRIHSLWLIAGFILLIACVNFINISTAQAVNRAREVGVRKVLGGRRQQLTLQFLLEALLLVLTALIFSVLLISLLIEPVSKMLDMPLSLDIFRQPAVLLFLAATTVIVTLLAGTYPALVLASFKPITALKTKLAARSSSGINLRRGLVVLQFVIAQALIIGTLLIVRQMNYFTHGSMGFNRDAVVSVPFPSDSVNLTKLNYLRDRLYATKGVRQVSFENSTPAERGNWHTDFNFDHAKEGTKFPTVSKFVNDGYIPTYGLHLVAGQNMSSNDSVKEFLINETLVRRLGFSDPRDVIGKEINLWNGFAVGPIVGVVRDFHSSPLRDSLEPVFMLKYKPAYSSAGIKIDGGDLSATMRAIEKIWSSIYPNYVFEYQFMDEKIADFYKEEAKLSLFYQVFASIAIFLSCLGLYGLASFMAAQRLKEVGIRKVLGATVANIVYLFSREFVLLIFIAFVISAPIAWYFVHQWMQQYVFRIPISGWIFAAGGLLALFIALATVSFQAFRAAAVNPVKNLRAE
jgi:predicted permease